MSDPFVTVYDLATYIGEEPGDNADLAIAAACDIVRHYIDNGIDPTIVTDQRVDGTGTDALLLDPPVREITSITELDVELTPDDDYYLGSSSGGIVYRVCGRWPFGRGNILASYIRGWDIDENVAYPGHALPLPDDIRLVALALAKRICAAGTEPTGGLTSETIGQYSYTTSDTAPGVFQLDDGEKRALDAYRMPGVA